MNIGEIAERFIRAAEIDLSHTGPVGPSSLKAMSLPYLHSQADKNGWGTERLAEERKEFWERVHGRPTAADITEADETRSWLTMVPDAGQRAALLAWADAQVGAGFFKDWCFRRGIHPITGTRRKDRALEQIEVSLRRRTVQHNETGLAGVLRRTPEISDCADIIAIDVTRNNGVIAWAADDAFSRAIIPELADFSWAAKRNERRRQQEARRRKEAA